MYGLHCVGKTRANTETAGANLVELGVLDCKDGWKGKQCCEQA